MMQPIYADNDRVDFSRLRHDSEGRLKVDATRRYMSGKCWFIVYGIPRFTAPSRQDTRVMLAQMEIPKDMPKGEQYLLLKNFAVLTGIHFGEESSIRHMTPIKGESNELR
jgi:hypothetical protein